MPISLLSLACWLHPEALCAWQTNYFLFSCEKQSPLQLVDLTAFPSFKTFSQTPLIPWTSWTKLNVDFWEACAPPSSELKWHVVKDTQSLNHRQRAAAED